MIIKRPLKLLFFVFSGITIFLISFYLFIQNKSVRVKLAKNILESEFTFLDNKLFFDDLSIINQNLIFYGVKILDLKGNELLYLNNLNINDHQGPHFAPHCVHKDIWNKVGGFSEEFNPGIASDPDFNMKLWKIGVRIFKGLNSFKVYHFGSLTTRKKKNFIQNRGDKTFLKKWGISTKFFKKYYLKSKTKYDGPLHEPNVTPGYILGLLSCKIKSIFTF